MQDAEVMNQLGELITEWNVVDEQLIPVRFDILLRCSDMGHDLEVHRSRHCGEHTQTIGGLPYWPLQSLMRDCRFRAQRLWEIDNDQHIRVMCICDVMHWARAVAATLQAIYNHEGYTSRGAFHMSGLCWHQDVHHNCMDVEKDVLSIALTENVWESW